MDTAVNPYVSIPLDHLIVSSLNARKIDGDSIEDLAASISAEGLLQNLTVIEGAAGVFEVIAGKRRLGALQLLRDRGQLPAGLDTPLCRVVDDERALSASLAENIVREAMHPADEFLAFKRLAEAGRSSEEIAQEFGVLPVVVERRLRLANVAPSLFELFQRDEIQLDQMMALAITDDHAAQEAAWNAATSPWEREAARLRGRLTQAEFNVAKDKAARFVGPRQLAEAGVIIRGDLFSDNGDGYCNDRRLVDELALQKLERDADAVRDEGWLWVEARIDYNPHSGEFGRIEPDPAGNLSKAESDKLDQLRTELSNLEDASEDDYTEEEEARYSTIEADIEALEERGVSWSPAQKAAAGAIVTINHHGQLEINRGLVRQSERRQAKAAGNGSATGGADAAKPKAAGDLSGTMLQRLNAQRTSMVQAAVFQRRDIALTVLAHTLLLGLLYENATWQNRPSKIRFAGPENLEKAAGELPLMRHYSDTQDALAAIRKSLPAPTKLLAWLLTQPSDTILSLLAAAGAMSIDAAMADAQDRTNPINEIIVATGVDFADHWEATPETFLSHVPRSAIEQAVREARGDADVAKLDGMKKDDLVEAAAQLLAGKRWLPKPLRVPKPKAPPAIAAVDPAPDAPDAPAKRAATKATKAKKKPAVKAKPKPKDKAAARKAPVKKAGKRK